LVGGVACGASSTTSSDSSDAAPLADVAGVDVGPADVSVLDLEQPLDASADTEDLADAVAPDLAEPDANDPVESDIEPLDLVGTDAVDVEAVDVEAVDVEAVDVEAVDSSQPVETCGNGVIDLGEACDDGGVFDRCTLDCAAVVDAGEVIGFGAKRSIALLPTSNGAVTAVVSTGPAAQLSTLFDAPWKALDEATSTTDLLYDAYFGYRTAAGGTWLSDVPVVSSGYVPGTGIVRVVQQHAGLTFETYWFAPYSTIAGDESDRAVVGLLRITAASGPVSGLRCHSLWNLHLGGASGPGTETVTALAGKRLVETGSGRTMVYDSLESEGLWMTSDGGGGPANPYVLAGAGATFEDVVSPPGDDRVVGFENRFGDVAAGESRWCGVVVRMQPALAPAALPAPTRSPAEWLAAEEAFWSAFHASGDAFDGASPAEAALAKQSAAVLKMSQVSEKAACPTGRCAGQLLASLPPGQWHITWVRDLAYAVLGLLAAGHEPEAAAAIEFLVKAEVRRLPDGRPYYQAVHLQGSDTSVGIWGLGLPLNGALRLSLARYFGGGLEESDENAAGPNLELDNLGLFLWALDAARLAGALEPAFEEEAWTFATAGVADVLVQLLDPATGLLVPDSSIWERHFCPHGACSEPETRKRHAYSAITAAYGLRRLGAWAAARGDSARAQLYGDRATSLTLSVRTSLAKAVPGLPRPAIAGNVEELPYEVYYLDGAAIEAVNFGLVHPAEALAFGTVDAFDAYLRIGAHSPGYRRNDDPTWYDRQEWVVIDLRVASALRRMGQLGRANTLFDWVTAVGTANAGLIPELLSDGVFEASTEDGPSGADPGGIAQGAWPMAGFGAGAWLLGLREKLGGDAF
jgi:GH15 family glucan-1,4-alpha-glucosidase